MLTSPPATNKKVAKRMDLEVNRGMVAGHYNPVRDHNMSGLT